MSRTHKHQDKFWFKHHDWDHPWLLNNWHMMFGIEATQAKFWHQWANRKCRRQVRQLIKDGQYVEAEMIKPMDVAWEIW